ncbi:MAG: ECF transporter S component [Clostridia bacterium]
MRRVAVCALIFGALILATTYFWSESNFAVAGLLMVVVITCPFIVRFERRGARAEEIVILAVLVAIASASRIPFAGLPSIQPTSFVVIMAGIALGAESGFLVGGLSALVSNMFLGQGPWTPWQMFAWGLMGFTAGLLRNTFIMKNGVVRVIFGFVWGFLFGWIMNMWYLLGLGENISFNAVLIGALGSASMDLAHGICNAVLLALFAASWLRVLNRTRQKFDIF